MQITFRAAWSTETLRENPKLTDIVVVETSNPDLVEVLEAFERFLRGAGFHFEGTVDIVPRDEDGREEEG